MYWQGLDAGEHEPSPPLVQQHHAKADSEVPLRRLKAAQVNEDNGNEGKTTRAQEEDGKRNTAGPHSGPESSRFSFIERRRSLHRVAFAENTKAAFRRLVKTQVGGTDGARTRDLRRDRLGPTELNYASRREGIVEQCGERHGCIYFSAAWKTSLIRFASQALHDRGRREENIMPTTYQGPFLIQFVGEPLSDVCLQAGYAVVDASVTIAPIASRRGRDPPPRAATRLCSNGSSAAISGSI